MGADYNEASKNTLSKKKCDSRDPTMMRYLHISANNMEVSESCHVSVTEYAYADSLLV